MSPEPTAPGAPFRAEPGLTCTACGRRGAFAFDGGPLCPDCTHERGSCCAGEDDACPAPANDTSRPQPE